MTNKKIFFVVVRQSFSVEKVCREIQQGRWSVFFKKEASV